MKYYADVWEKFGKRRDAMAMARPYAPGWSNRMYQCQCVTRIVSTVDISAVCGNVSSLGRYVCRAYRVYL